MPALDPRIHVDLAHLAGLEARARGFDFLPRQPVGSALSGRRASRLRGRGLEFEEIRAYLPGDDVRAIDWKVTARTGSPHVRVTREERDRPALIVVDQRQAMFFGTVLNMKSVTAAEIAALAAWRILGAGDRVGGLVLSDAGLAAVPAGRSRGAVLRLLDLVADRNLALSAEAPVSTEAAGRLDAALAQAARIVTHDWLVLVVSDFDGAERGDAAHPHRHRPRQRPGPRPGPRPHRPRDPRTRPHRRRRRPPPGRARPGRRAGAAQSRRGGRRPADAAPRLAGAARRRDPAGQRRRAHRAAAPAPVRRAAAPEAVMEPQEPDKPDRPDRPAAGHRRAAGRVDGAADLGLGRRRRRSSSPPSWRASGPGVRHRRATAWRRAALAELRALAPALEAGEPGALARLQTLLRRVALVTAPRAEVAGLTGADWAEFLDTDRRRLRPAGRDAGGRPVSRPFAFDEGRAALDGRAAPGSGGRHA